MGEVRVRVLMGFAGSLGVPTGKDKVRIGGRLIQEWTVRLVWVHVASVARESATAATSRTVWRWCGTSVSFELFFAATPIGMVDCVLKFVLIKAPKVLRK